MINTYSSNYPCLEPYFHGSKGVRAIEVLLITDAKPDLAHYQYDYRIYNLQYKTCMEHLLPTSTA